MMTANRPIGAETKERNVKGSSRLYEIVSFSLGIRIARVAKMVLVLSCFLNYEKCNR